MPRLWQYVLGQVHEAPRPRNSQSTDVDNPDQRISEDVDYFTKVTLDFLPLSLHMPALPRRESWAFA